MLVGMMDGDCAGTLDVFVKVNGSSMGAVKIQISEGCKLSDLLKKSTEKLKLSKPAKTAYFSNGLEVDDIGHVEDQETLYISLWVKNLCRLKIQETLKFWPDGGYWRK